MYPEGAQDMLMFLSYYPATCTIVTLVISHDLHNTVSFCSCQFYLQYGFYNFAMKSPEVNDVNFSHPVNWLIWWECIDELGFIYFPFYAIMKFGSMEIVNQSINMNIYKMKESLCWYMFQCIQWGAIMTWFRTPCYWIQYHSDKGGTYQTCQYNPGYFR